jgi:hypothetical protein
MVKIPFAPKFRKPLDPANLTTLTSYHKTGFVASVIKNVTKITVDKCYTLC